MKVCHKFLLTIGREYGCSGKKIADIIGEDLGVPVFDRNLIAMIAKKHGYDETALTDSDEKVTIPFFEPYSSYGSDIATLPEQLFTHQAQIIKEEADKGPAIFIGRCANDILRHYDDLVNVFLYAPKPWRIEQIMQAEDIEDSTAAEKIVRRIDKTRRSYYQFYTDKKWGSTEGMDMLINVSTVGVDGVVAMIEALLKQRGYIE